jgi:hypothetical protein
MDLNDWIVTADTIKTALQLHKTILIASIQTTIAAKGKLL